MTKTDLCVIGGGPAGLAATIYAASEGLTTLTLGGEQWGGQASRSMAIENLSGLGNQPVTGNQLTLASIRQCIKFGAELIRTNAVGLHRYNRNWIVETSRGEVLLSRAVIIATGLQFKKPLGYDLPIHFGTARGDVTPWLGQPVAVLGGGNSAGQAALFLASLGQSVTMSVRRDLSATMSQYLIDRIDANPNIQVTVGLTPQELSRRAVAAYSFIGQIPATHWLPDDHVTRTDAGYILAPNHIANDGLFVAGDVREGSTKRIAAAMGEAAQSVAHVHTYLREF